MKQLQVDQRLIAAGAVSPFDGDEHGKAGDARDQADPGPGRPSLVAPEDQRYHQQPQCSRQPADPGRVQALSAALGVGRKHPSSDDEQDGTEGDVDQEDRPPGCPEQVGGDQQASRRLPDHGATGEDRCIPAQRPGLGGPGVVKLDPGQHLAAAAAPCTIRATISTSAVGPVRRPARRR